MDLFKRSKRKRDNLRNLRGHIAKYPKQFNLRVNEKQLNILRDWQSLTKKGAIDDTIPVLFRQFVDQLEPQLRALIIEHDFEGAYDWVDHPKRKKANDEE